MGRTFAAPRDVVFAAHTQAEHLSHWWGRGNPLDVSIDFTVGGSWRFVEHAGGEQHVFRGEFRAIDAPPSYTWTFEYQPMAGHVAVERFEFTEVAGLTTVTCTATFTDRRPATACCTRTWRPVPSRATARSTRTSTRSPDAGQSRRRARRASITSGAGQSSTR